MKQRIALRPITEQEARELLGCNELPGDDFYARELALSHADRYVKQLAQKGKTCK